MFAWHGLCGQILALIWPEPGSPRPKHTAMGMPAAIQPLAVLPLCLNALTGLLFVLQDVAVSSGSACTSASLEPSYVLRALGVGDEMAHSSLRFGIGRFTTAEEVDRAVALTVQHVQKLREMSPLWEMVQEGIDINSIQWSSH